MINLTNLETYVSGIQLPDVVQGIIRPAIVPLPLTFENARFFVITFNDEDSVLNAFPLLVFRTNEDTNLIAGDKKEVRLYGLSGGDNISLNSYIRATVTILKSI